MIEWPREIPNESGRRGLAQFRATGAAARLEADGDTWRVTAWPWTVALPVRIVFENSRHEALMFTKDEAGLWRMDPCPMAVKTRSDASLVEEAEGPRGVP